MTKQEAISLLEGETIRCRMAPKINGCPMTEDWQLTIEVCEIAIAAIKAQDERRWIPVAERLPDIGIEVLVYSEDDGICVDYYDGASFGYYGVTHWMPLPEPPKEKRNDLSI